MLRVADGGRWVTREMNRAGPVESMLAAGLLVLMTACGGTQSPNGTQVPVTVMSTSGPGCGIPVLATTSIVQLQALLVAFGCVIGAGPPCPASAPYDLCWPEAKPPPSSLLVALHRRGGGGPAPTLTATFGGTELTLEQTYPTSISAGGVALAPFYLELAVIPLGSLPKAVISVVGLPPWGGPNAFGGAAIVDLRDPLPGDVDLGTTIDSLIAAQNAASKDAGVRLNLTNPQYAAVNRVGVRRWDDSSLGCPGVAASSQGPVSGYIFFLTQAGTLSRELEYHTGAGRTVFCGYSH